MCWRSIINYNRVICTMCLGWAAAVTFAILSYARIRGEISPCRIVAIRCSRIIYVNSARCSTRSNIYMGSIHWMLNSGNMKPPVRTVPWMPTGIQRNFRTVRAQFRSQIMYIPVDFHARLGRETVHAIRASINTCWLNEPITRTLHSFQASTTATTYNLWSLSPPEY